MLRTNTCGELTKKDIGKNVTLCGWNQSRRDHGGVIFVDLRDRYGLTQIVADPSHKKEVHKVCEKVRREDVLRAIGKVRHRGKDLENPKLKTGEIEVLLESLEILNSSETPPIEIDDRQLANEEIRMKYRYLDLRRPEMQRNLLVRHKASMAVREYMNSENFLEIQTPMLVKSTPEGARDYLVPSRVNPGHFYALPQSPQLYKQILMVAGFDRYYQFPICLRDEDLRADRQPEHTQIDIEMSFVEIDDIFNVVENLMKSIFKKTLNIDLKTPFERLKHSSSIDRYGLDKPDLRFGLEITDITSISSESDFSVFKDAVKKGGVVKCLNLKGCGTFSRKDIEEMTEFVAIYGAKGLAWAKMEEELKSSIVKYFKKPIQDKIIKATNAEKGDLIVFIADNRKIVNESFGQLRNFIGKKLKLYDEKEFQFCWVTDFPLFEYDDKEDRIKPAHHMFCMPKKEDIKLLEKKPLEVYCTQYDLVLNGVELASGSIRITDPELQKTIMKIIGMTEKEANEKFGFLLESFKYGVPPHGGIGIGFDRLVAMICGYNDIREVIAFPKNKNAANLMDGCPTKLSDKDLKEQHIKLDFIQK